TRRRAAIALLSRGHQPPLPNLQVRRDRIFLPVRALARDAQALGAGGDGAGARFLGGRGKELDARRPAALHRLEIPPRELSYGPRAGGAHLPSLLEGPGKKGPPQISRPNAARICRDARGFAFGRPGRGVHEPLYLRPLRRRSGPPPAASRVAGSIEQIAGAPLVGAPRGRTSRRTVQGR